MRTLLLWDIDGTLIHSGGAGLRALDQALRAEFRVEGSIDDIDFAGRTDRWIARQIFAKFGMEPSERNFTRLFERYFELLPHHLSHPTARVLPGVEAVLVAAAKRGGIAQGLLTGNLRRGAEIKLRHHRLWDHFPFGAFADDAELRPQLGPHALRRARDHHRVEFKADRVWVIGDTPHDIECGRAIGARTLAIAAGAYSAEQLAAHHPDLLIASYADTDGILQALDLD